MDFYDKSRYLIKHESLSGVYDTQKKPSKVGEKKGVVLC